MSSLSNSDIGEITRQSDLVSKIPRDKTQINNISSAATNAETTQARPNHSTLNDRLNSIQNGQASYMKTGGEVTASAPAAMTVEIAAGEANVDGVDIKWSAVTSETIVAPVALSTGGTTYQMYVVVVENAQTTGGSFVNLIASNISETKELPTITDNQKPIAVLEITSSTATITASEITDARDQGAFYCLDGRWKWKWKIQDAIDDLSTAGGEVFVGKGIYYETLNHDYNVELNFDLGVTLYDVPGTKKEVNGRSYELAENLTAGDIVRLINEGDTAKLRKVTGFGNLAGSETTSHNASTNGMWAVALSDSKIFVCYCSATDYEGIVATVTNSTLSFGSAVSFNTASDTEYLHCIKLSETSALIVYRDIGNSNYGTGIVASISGTTVTYGSEYVFISSAVTHVSSVLIDTNKALISYTNAGAGTKGETIIATVSGTTISYGTVYRYDSGDTHTYMFPTKLSATKVFLSTVRGTGPNIGQGLIATISGTVVSYGSQYTFDASGAVTYTSCCTLRDNKVFIAWADGGSTLGKCIIASISGTVISYGSEHTFNYNGAVTFVNCIQASEEEVIITYRDVGNSDYGTIIEGKVFGDTISFTKSTVYNSGATTECNSVLIGNRNLCVSFNDAGDSSKGKAIIVDLENRDEFIGVLMDTGNDGDTKNIIQRFNNIYYNYSSLDVSKRYYIDTDGSKTTTINNFPFGVSISETSMMLF
jgi:hypothetical protein